MAFIYAEFSEKEDLNIVSENLRSQYVEHRFVLEGDKQQLLLINRDDVLKVSELIERWRAGNLSRPQKANSGTGSSSKNSFVHLLANTRPAPLSLSFVFLGFVGFALAGFGEQFIHLFTFWDSTPSLSLVFAGFSPWVDIQNGEIWRLLTPVFLHFGAMHIVFNALWIWYLGTLVEFNHGFLRALGIFLLVGIISNSAQAFISTEEVRFGGLSGLVHGLFGYCWLWGCLNRYSKVRLQTGLFIIVTLLMILSSTGLFDILIGANIADTAHISGYISGMILASFITLIQRAGINLGFK